MKVLFDTNVLLDFFLPRKPFYSAAAQLIALTEAQKHEAYLAAISINNAYYLINKAQNSVVARRCVREL